MAQKKAQQTKSSRSATQTPARKKPLTVFVAVFVVVVLGVMVFLVYRNNQESKASHAEFAATQEDFKEAENSFKKASQGLVDTADECDKSYKDYGLCSSLRKTHKEIEDEYSAVKQEVESLDSSDVPRASSTLKNSIVTVQGLERTANEAVTNYKESLLQAVKDEHAALVSEVYGNLKAAQALLSESQGKTSDEDLWTAFSRILELQARELPQQELVEGDDINAYISSTEKLRVENSAIISTTNHLREIYEKGPQGDGQDAPAEQNNQG